MAVWTSYDTVGAVEDVSDVITNISPRKTPFQQSLANEKVHQRHFQWQEDVLRAVAVNAQIEGFTAVENAPVATTLRTNETQIMQETVKVAGSSDATDYYGRAKESAYQLAKAMAGVKRDLEYALIGQNTASVTGSDGAARKFASFYPQLLNDGTGVLSSTNTAVYTGASTVKLTEGNLEDVLQQVWSNGAEPKVIMVTPTNARTVSDFAKASGRYRTLESGSSAKDQRSIINVVDLYVSPFGEQRVINNRFMRGGPISGGTVNTIVYDPDMWRLMVFRPWFRETLAKTGDNLAQMIVGEFSLKHKNFSASGSVVEAAGNTTY
jgi:Family of unknown function (DUF5309)